MRRAFTLIELLAVVAIIGAMVSVSVVSISRGRAAGRMKGAVRDVFATIRQARSIALVTGKPSIISFSSKKIDGETVSKVEITSAEMTSSAAAVDARNIDGEWKRLGDGEEAGDEGHTVEEMLFSPIAEDVLTGVCIKAVSEEEAPAIDWNEADEAKKSKASAFSNVDFLLGEYKEAKEQRDKEKAEAAAKESAETAAAPPQATEEVEAPKSVVWEVNGRCEPHRVYVYEEGRDPYRDGWLIKVDRFGAAKILSPGEEDR